MLLAIDIGNSNIVAGLYNGEQLKDYIRIASRVESTSDEYGLLISRWLEMMKLSGEEIEEVVLGSVVPPLTVTFEKLARNYFGCTPIIVSGKMNLPIRIEIDQPEQVGADRICNSVAAFTKYGGPVIVADFGTATTFDIVSKEGAYIGGVITPGPLTSMAELARKAARLFEIKIEPPDKVIGKSTAGALKSGLFYGTVGQTDYIIKKILEQSGFSVARVIATGGLATGLEKHSDYIKQVEPTLTLEGLRLIAELNAE